MVLAEALVVLRYVEDEQVAPVHHDPNRVQKYRMEVQIDDDDRDEAEEVQLVVEAGVEGIALRSIFAAARVKLEHHYPNHPHPHLLRNAELLS